MAASSEASTSAPDDHHEDAVAETPLLDDGRPRINGSAGEDQESILKHAKPLTSIVLYFMTIHFLLAFCDMILVAPLIRLYENSLCLSYFEFPAGGVEESFCKIEEIQRPLATLRGWKSMFDTIPGTESLVRGCRWALMRSKFYLLLFQSDDLAIIMVAGKLWLWLWWELPVLSARYSQFVSSNLLIVPGRFWSFRDRDQLLTLPRCISQDISTATGVALLCDSLVWRRVEFSFCVHVGHGIRISSYRETVMSSKHVDHRKLCADVSCSRSHAFYYIFSAFYVAELVASFTASITMDISPWIPCGLSMASVFLCLTLLAIGPDPRKSPDSSFSANPPQSIPEENISLSDQDPKTLPKSELVSGIFSALSDRNTMLLIPVFLMNIFRYAMLNLLIQYASVRFGLKISTGATFYTETALINIILFLFLVPRLTAYIRLAYNVRPETIDLVLVRTSAALLALGCLAIGLSQNSTFLPIGK